MTKILVTKKKINCSTHIQLQTLQLLGQVTKTTNHKKLHTACTITSIVAYRLQL